MVVQEPQVYCPSIEVQGPQTCLLGGIEHLASAAAAVLWKKAGVDDHMQQMYLLSTCDMREKGRTGKENHPSTVK
jgi:hypothetical protein